MDESGSPMERSNGLASSISASERRTIARVLDARCALSLGVVELVVDEVRDDQVAKLRIAAEAAMPSSHSDRATMELSEFVDVVIPFSECLVGLAENHLLLDMLRSLKISAAFERILPGVGDADMHAAWAEGRMRIVDAVASRDRALASEAVRAYHSDVKERFFSRHAEASDHA
ncbi:FCD domain-containing protein [Rhodococcus fascians]|nr:FCD domain-containing protein [Rhodococcus fascians]MBY4114686.1 FCD domain-containing protein [Rhodococcus fascians]